MKSGKNQNVDYILLNFLPSTTLSPSFQKAQHHRSQCSTSGNNRKSNQLQSVFRFKTEEFKRYGSGVYLFFSLIKMMLVTFVIISFNSLPIILSNFKGDGLKMYGESSIAKSVMRLSLGNQRHEQYDRVLSDSSIRTDIFISQTIIVVIDMLNSVIFLVFLIIWKIKSDEMVSQFLVDDALPSYYTLQVKNLPDSYTEESIIKHFNLFGVDIAQIATVYDYQNILTEVKYLIKLVDKYVQQQQIKRELTYKKIQVQLKKILSETSTKKLKPMISIITFEDMLIRKKLREMSRYKIYQKQLTLDNNILKINNCRVEPSSIIWENYHLEIKVEIRQSIIVAFVLILVLVVALVVLFIINAHSTSMVEKQQEMSRYFNYNANYSYQQAKKLGTFQSLFVFCSKINYHNFTLEYYYFCQPYFNSYRQQFTTMIGLSLLIMLINMVLNWIIKSLAYFRRYKTKTQKNRFLIISTFILNFINSALLILLIRIQIFGYSLSKIINKIVPLPENLLGIQSYRDFNRKWYINIGSQVVVIYAMSLIITPFLQIILSWIQSKCRVFRAKRAKTQYKMNELLLDNEFDFQSFYVMILTTVFFTMFYGNAIPVLYLLSIVGFCSLYIASFIVFKNFSCKPMMFDHSLNLIISRVLCIALILHQITSILFLYTDDIFPILVDIHDYGIVSKIFGKIVQGIHFVMLGFIFVGVAINYNKICRSVKKYLLEYFNQKVLMEKQPKLFREIFGEMTDENNLKGNEMSIEQRRKKDYLSSYNMQQNPSYLKISYALKILSAFQPYFLSNGEQFHRSSRSNSRDILTLQVKKEDLIKQIVDEESQAESAGEEVGGKILSKQIDVDEAKGSQRKFYLKS